MGMLQCSQQLVDECLIPTGVWMHAGFPLGSCCVIVPLSTTQTWCKKSIIHEQAMITHTYIKKKKKKKPAWRKKYVEPALTEVREVPNNFKTIHLMNTEFVISINLTAAVTCRGDPHGRWCMFCNVESQLELEQKRTLLQEHNITERRGGKRREKNPNLCWVMISMRGWPEFKHTDTHPRFVPLLSE